MVFKREVHEPLCPGDLMTMRTRIFYEYLIKIAKISNYQKKTEMCLEHQITF